MFKTKDDLKSLEKLQSFLSNGGSLDSHFNKANVSVSEAAFLLVFGEGQETESKQEKIVEFLVENGLDLKKKFVARDETSSNAGEDKILGTIGLLYAFKKGNIEIAKFLLKKIDDPNIVIAGEPFINLAVKQQNEEMISFLLNQGSDPNRKGESKKNAVELANESGNEKIAAIFFSHSHSPANHSDNNHMRIEHICN